MNENPDLAKLREEDATWERLTTKQKAILVWFNLSLFLLVACGESFWLAMLIVVNFAFASYMVTKNVPIKEQKGGVYGK